jgi:signal peptidase I
LSLKLSGVFSWYKMSTSVMEPNLSQNSIVFTTNLLEYDRNDFVVFKTDHISEPFIIESKNKDSKTEPYMIDHSDPFIFRVIAKEGDTLLIKNGDVFCNGKNIDLNIKLAHSYKYPLKKYYKLRKEEKYYNSYEKKRLINQDTIIVDMDDNLATSFKVSRYLTKKKYSDKEIEKVYGKRWNKDNFGPIVIPTNNYFLLGDNRDNSFDSRFIGLIDKEYIIGKMIFKY